MPLVIISMIWPVSSNCHDMKHLVEYTTISGCLLLLLLSCATSQVKQAQKAFQEGHYQKSVDLYTQIMNNTPEPQYGYNLALSLLALGQGEEAIKVLTPLLEKYPENMLLLRATMIAYFSTKNYKQTDMLAKKILTLNPYDFFGKIYESYLLYGEKESKQAIIAMKNLYKDSADPRVMIAIAKTSYQAGQKVSASFWLEKYTQKQGNADDFFLLASWQIEQRKYAEAEGSLISGLGKKNVPLQQFYLARLYLLFLKNRKLGTETLKKSLEAGFKSSKDFQELLDHPRLQNKVEVQKIIAQTKPEKKETTTSP